MKKQLITILLFIFLSGCGVANYQSLKLGTVDGNNKNISVPGAGNALFEIKSALINAGWKVKIGDASLNEVGAVSQKVDTTTRVKFDTAYRMYMTSTLSSNRNHGITRFNLSIVDNKTNEEILNMVGNREDYVRYKPEDIAKNLIKNLKELQHK